MPIAIAIIPARYKSKRFPGKPLALISGVPLIVRVMQSARNSQRIKDIIVATDNQRIAQAVKDCGGNVFFSQREHATGSDRVAEAAANIDCDYVVNLQGDEPFLPAKAIDKVVHALEIPDVVMSSACTPIRESTEANNPNVVKVVLDNNGDALYFSRSRIPFHRADDGTMGPLYRHIGIYGFKRSFLMKFTQLERSPLEISESLEQLRALEHGYRIRVVIVESEFAGIDTPEDLIRVEEIFSRQGKK